VRVKPEVVAEVKAVLFFGDDTSDDRSRFAPGDPEHFGVSVQAFIGEVGDDLSDSFDVVVCSPSWFAAQAASGRSFAQGAPLGMPSSVTVGSAVWFMQRWDRAEFESALTFICDTFSPAPDWGTVASRIGRVVPWEFDADHDHHINERFGEPFPRRSSK